MTIREEYENLKTELIVRLADATTMCALEFPFDLEISKEEETRYFIRGANTRLATKKSMIILDNTYKKVRLFPSDDIADIFIEARDGILEDYKKDVMDAYNGEKYTFMEDTLETYSAYIDSLISKIKEASKPYIEKLKTLTKQDIEKEIDAKDKLLNLSVKANSTINSEDKKELF